MKSQIFPSNRIAVAILFGYFSPAVVAFMWEAGRAKVAPRDAAREFIAAAHDFGRSRLSGVSGLAEFNAAATKVIDHARQHVAGLSLFAAVAAEPTPPTSDAAALAMHQLMVLREFRGSAHLVAVVATELPPHTAHYIRRPDMYAMFGWSTDAPPAVGDAELAALRAADELTDRLVGPAYDALDATEAATLVRCLRDIDAAVESATIPGAGT